MNDLEKIKKKISSILEKELPAAPSPAWLSKNFGKLECVRGFHLKGLLDPTRSLLEQGGKRWRPSLLVLCAMMATSERQKIENAFRLTPLLEFVHTASLIHDDIEDGATERRGKPCGHIAFGLDVALNAASWLYFKAASCINSVKESSDRKKILYDLYAEEIRRLHLGQAMDIAWHNAEGVFPSADEYRQMVRLKTGTLSCLAAKAGFFLGGVSLQVVERAGKIAAAIGEGFQILDDAQNLETGNPGKKKGDDIVEGKKSLPVLIFANENPSAKNKIAALFNRAKKEGIESPAVEQAISILQKSGAVQKAKSYGKKIVSENVFALASILKNEKSESAKMIFELFGVKKNLTEKK